MGEDDAAGSGSAPPQGRLQGLGTWIGRLFGGGSRQALHRAQQQATRAEARLREAIDVLPQGIVFLDREGRYILWNAKYAEIYHRSADLFKEGVRLADTLRVGVARGDYPEAVGREQEWLAARLALLDNPGERHEQRLADGRWVMIEERRTSDGGVIGLRVDITDMKHQAEALETALHRAEAANHAKTEFLANLSHEIKTPLNGVLGLADVLGRSELTAAQRGMLETITASAQSLNVILADLLEFSRLESGRVEIADQAFDLAGLVEGLEAQFKPRAAQKGLAFEVGLAEGARRRVRGDPARVRQILANLLDNAIKFTVQGRIEFEVAPAADEADRYVFEVRDTGPGFEPEDAERLFARFEQADTSATREHGGLGLGLAICRQLAGLMGGTVAATGQRGVGATFTLALPLRTESPSEPSPVRPPEAAVSADAAGPESGPEAEPGELEQTLRVLVTDDNATNRKVAELILQAIGAEVVAAENGLEAVEAVQAGPFDLILMDLQMPVMDGLTAIRRIRDLEAAQGRARTPVVVLSANTMPEQREASAAAGADEHLGKPIRADDLISAIVRAVQGGDAAA